MCIKIITDNQNIDDYIKHMNLEDKLNTIIWNTFPKGYEIVKRRNIIGLYLFNLNHKLTVDIINNSYRFVELSDKNLDKFLNMDIKSRCL